MGAVYECMMHPGVSKCMCAISAWLLLPEAWGQGRRRVGLHACSLRSVCCGVDVEQCRSIPCPWA
jgi:hypothetical protein